MPAVSRTMHTEESAEVEVLMANMEKLKALTKKIGSSLDKLDASGKTVQTSVRPIYGNTGRLQSRNANVEGVRHELGKIRADLDKRRKEEPIIRGGVKNSSLAEYTGAMTRTRNTLEELRRSNLKSNQAAITEMEGLLGLGQVELEGVFRDTTRDASQHVEPLFYITKGVPFPAISEEDASKLRLINTTMLSSLASQSSPNEPRTERIYADIRGTYVSKTLHTLAAGSLTTARKTDTNALYRHQQNGIGSYCKAVEDLFAAEYDNITSIYESSQHTSLHTRVVEPALAEFTKTLVDLDQHIQGHLLTDCFLGYEIIDLVSRLSTRVDSRNPSLKSPLNDALRPIRSTSKKSVTSMKTDVEARVNSLMTLPADGSPVQPTLDVMARAVSMTDYLTPLGSILATSNTGGTDASSFDVGADSETLFSAYLGSLLESLLTTLDSKSRTLLKTKGAQGVFIANNIAVIDRQLQSQAFVLIPLEVPRAKINPFRKKGIKVYVDTWLDLARNLQDQFYTGGSGGQKASLGRPPSGNPSDSAAFLKSLSSKEKDGIKDRFKNFNTGFDDLIQRHKTYKLEPEVRQEVQRDVSDFLVPLYGRFYDRYKEIDKGKGKVVKYDRGQLAVLLASL